MSVCYCTIQMGKIVNAIDAFVQFGTLASSVDEDTIGEIKDEKMTTIFGQPKNTMF